MPITPDTAANAAHDAIDDAEDQVELLEDFISERPLLSLGIAALVGFVLAKTILSERAFLNSVSVPKR